MQVRWPCRFRRSALTQLLERGRPLSVGSGGHTNILPPFISGPKSTRRGPLSTPVTPLPDRSSVMACYASDSGDATEDKLLTCTCMRSIYLAYWPSAALSWSSSPSAHIPAPCGRTSRGRTGTARPGIVSLWIACGDGLALTMDVTRGSSGFGFCSRSRTLRRTGRQLVTQSIAHRWPSWSTASTRRP